MKTRPQPMSFKAYQVMPREPGWKYEYMDGHLYRSPSHTIVTGRLKLEPRPAPALPNGVSLRPIQPELMNGLLEAAFDAFHDTIEYCDWETEKIRKNLHHGLERLLSSAKKPLLGASRVALEGSRVIGAAFIVKSAPGPELVLFFVMPGWQRRGVGRALLRTATNTLLESGSSDLHVTWHAGNPASAAFYPAHGFEIQPDWFHAHHMRHIAHHNLDHALHVGVGIEVARLEFERWSERRTGSRASRMSKALTR